MLIAVTHSDDAGNLNGLKDAVIVISFNGGQGVKHLSIPGRKPHPKARHPVRLTKRGKLNTNVFSPRNR